MLMTIHFLSMKNWLVLNIFGGIQPSMKSEIIIIEIATEIIIETTTYTITEIKTAVSTYWFRALDYSCCESICKYIYIIQHVNMLILS